ARIMVNWDQVPPATLEPNRIPPEVELKAMLPANNGRPSLSGPGRTSNIDLEAWRRDHRVQRLEFQLAAALTRDLARAGQVPPHSLFRQLQPIVTRYLREKVTVLAGTDIKDIFLSPY